MTWRVHIHWREHMPWRVIECPKVIIHKRWCVEEDLLKIVLGGEVLVF
jgi:hypothetical protein